MAHVTAQEGCEGDNRGRVGNGGERRGGVGECVTAQGEPGDERVVGGEVPRGHTVEDSECGVGEVVAEVAGEEGVVGGGGAERHGLEGGAGALHVARARQPGDARVRIHHRRRRARRQEADGREAHVGWATVTTTGTGVGSRPLPTDAAASQNLYCRCRWWWWALELRNVNGPLTFRLESSFCTFEATIINCKNFEVEEPHLARRKKHWRLRAHCCAPVCDS